MRKGFTLMELMIVIVILGGLAAIIMPNLMGTADKAKNKLVCVQMKNIKETLKLFKMDQGNYPTTSEGIESLITNPDVDKYKNYPTGSYFEDKKLPKDSWGNKFIYINKGGTIELISFGSDKVEGGDVKDIFLSKCIQ